MFILLKTEAKSGGIFDSCYQEWNHGDTGACVKAGFKCDSAPLRNSFLEPRLLAMLSAILGREQGKLRAKDGPSIIAGILMGGTLLHYHTCLISEPGPAGPAHVYTPLCHVERPAVRAQGLL